jgi:hypothetical protein
MNREELRKEYLDSAEKFRLQEASEDRMLLYLSLLRFLCFAGGVILIVLMFLRNPLPGFFTLFVVASIFIFLLKFFSDHSRKKVFAGNLSRVNANEADAVSGKLSQFEPGNRYIDISHDFSFDVDLFGDASLFQYLNRTVTGYGRDILAGWLADPYVVTGNLRDRQEIIRELSSKKSWRHRFMSSGMKVPFEKDQVDGLLSWMRDDNISGSSALKKSILIILPAITLISAGLLIAGILHYSIFIFIILCNLAFVASGLKATNMIHRDLSGRYTQLSSMNMLLEAFEYESFNSSTLNEIKSEISGSGGSAAAAVKKLGRLIESFDSRLNMIGGFVLNGLVLWDFQCILRLEKWKSENKDHFPLWLETLGKVDAFVSLGNYAYNNNNFVYPVLSDSNIIFSAGSLGHPLIEDEKRICNSFTLSQSGNICIITGANMAGKSTFLRTVAVNFMLGMTGCPVCASDMVFSPVKLFTSMRTTDSLSSHESYFYAELKRLKILKARISNKEHVFFILDEILKGTNSTDKALGSRMFIERLVELEGTGLIATHDISLGEMEKEYPEKIFNMCFEIEIDGEAIKFDYRLQPGITKKMNAALLMKQMGILD